MNATRIAELVAEIQKAEAEIADLRAQAAAIDKRYNARTSDLAGYKKALAKELKEFMPTASAASAAPRTRKPRKAPAPRAQTSTGGTAPTGGKKKTDVVRDFYADGLEHSSADVQAHLDAQGVEVSNLAVLMSNLAKSGELVRVSRGSYRKATAAAPAATEVPATT